MKPTLSGAPCAIAGSGNAPARLIAAVPFNRSRRDARKILDVIPILPVMAAWSGYCLAAYHHGMGSGKDELTRLTSRSVRRCDAARRVARRVAPPDRAAIRGS